MPVKYFWAGIIVLLSLTQGTPQAQEPNPKPPVNAAPASQQDEPSGPDAPSLELLEFLGDGKPRRANGSVPLNGNCQCPHRKRMTKKMISGKTKKCWLKKKRTAGQPAAGGKGSDSVAHSIIVGHNAKVLLSAPTASGQPAAGGEDGSRFSFRPRHCLAHTRVETLFFQALPGWLSLVPLGMLCLLLGNPWSVHAEDAGVRWDQLGPAEQRVLQPHADRWGSMSSNQQERLQKGAKRWSGLPPDKKRQFNKRFKNWEEMPPGKRSRIRERYQQFRNLPPEERERIHRSRQRFKNLPLERRQKLKNRWRGMTPEQRQRFRERKQFMQNLPPHERRAVRERLRHMNPEQRHQFRQEMRHPHQREGMRRFQDSKKQRKKFDRDKRSQRNENRRHRHQQHHQRMR